MDKIRNNLWLGNSLDVKNIPNLTKAGVTMILNVAFDLNDPIHHPDFFCLPSIKIPLIDGPNNPSWLKKMAIDTLVQLLKEQQTVLVHCHEGVGRSPWVTANALAILENSTFEEKYDEIRKIRPQIRFPNRLQPKLDGQDSNLQQTH